VRKKIVRTLTIDFAPPGLEQNHRHDANRPRREDREIARRPPTKCSRPVDAKGEPHQIRLAAQGAGRIYGEPEPGGYSVLGADVWRGGVRVEKDAVCGEDG
jgi:hypothetical protein